MAKIVTITETFNLNPDSNNPLSVKATITAENDGDGWTWNVDAIIWVEAIIGDKEAIDLTKAVLSNKRALSLITSQVADMQEEIIDALAEHEPETRKPDNSLFEQFASITKAHAKAFYGIDLNGGKVK